MTYYPRSLTGRNRTAADNSGTRVHAVPDNDPYSWARALCGAEPGRLSNGWSGQKHDSVTCQKCLRKMQTQGGAE